MEETQQSPAVARLHLDDEDDEEPCEELNLTFDDIDEDALMQSLNEADSDCGAASAGKHEAFVEEINNDYILGTLIVRVVAARDLEAVNKHGLGNILFGTNSERGARRSSSASKGGGTSNPYAHVRFGTTTQRTSEVYGTTDPIWPRGEGLYMDVTHAAPDPVTVDEAAAITETAQKSSVVGQIGGEARQAILEGTHPGDPPKKEAAAAASKMKHDQNEEETQQQQHQQTTLTVAIFHTNDTGRLQKIPKKQMGDSDDVFLGMTSLDVTPVLTGKVGVFDEWLPLAGSHSDRASVRVVCEYEASDTPPQTGDLVKFTNFCNLYDLFPATHNRTYRVQEVDGDNVLISWTSAEGWVSTYRVHRFMLLCVDRHHSFVDIYQEELASIRERISHSPMVHVVQETIDKVPEEGLIVVGADVLKNATNLLGRWWEGGLERTKQDITFATNWDGRNNPRSTESLATVALESSDSSQTAPDLEVPTRDPLPNMPNCPITGEPMRDPVVAADGHTYERVAISRWLRESNRSPLTGAVLVHKDLVPNYILLSSLQEAAVKPPAVATEAPPPASLKSIEEAAVVEEEEEGTAEVSIDD